jgi:hypothetical protein
MTTFVRQGYTVRSMARDEIIPKCSIYEYDAVTVTTGEPSKHKIGDKIRMSDGRVYHWARNGTASALTPGMIVQNSVTPVGHRNMTPTAISPIGDTAVQVVPVTTSIAVNEYANGYLWMNAGAGIGTPYRIKSNPAITLSVAGYIYLYDPLIVATIVATSKISLARNPWYGTILMPTSITGIPVGVCPVDVPASTATIIYYYWCQTWGPACILAGGTQVIGTPGITPGTRVGGGIVQAAYGVPVIGMLMNSLQVTDNEYAGVFLQISQ